MYHIKSYNPLLEVNYSVHENAIAMDKAKQLERRRERERARRAEETAVEREVRLRSLLTKC